MSASEASTPKAQREGLKAYYSDPLKSVYSKLMSEKNSVELYLSGLNKRLEKEDFDEVATESFLLNKKEAITNYLDIINSEISGYNFK